MKFQKIMKPNSEANYLNYAINCHFIGTKMKFNWNALTNEEHNILQVSFSTDKELAVTELKGFLNQDDSIKKLSFYSDGLKGTFTAIL